MKKIVALTLIFAFCLVFTACSTIEDDVMGTWELDIINDVERIDGVWDTIELYEGGTGRVINHGRSFTPSTGIVSFPRDIDSSLTWEITDDDIINIHYTDEFYGDGTCGFKLSGDTLTSVDGKYVFNKATTPIEDITLKMTEDEYKSRF